MSGARTDRVREILDLAMERPSGERAAFVAGAAAGDEATRAEVMSLVTALAGDEDALEPPRAVDEQRAPAAPLTGLTFAAYVVGERIGEGGMGVVYSARDTRLGRAVAVKAVAPALARDPHRLARLEQEARLLASLTHPAIAAIYGLEETARGPVLVLEFVPGRTLAEELASRRLSVEESVAIAVRIAGGLEAAHAAGIVHRDLKPANIKITPDGEAKILDFGVAKSWAGGGSLGAGAGAALGTDVATHPGMIVGSAAYMSPEQARGRAVDRRADLWALGCILFEMLTGERAFAGGTTSDTLAAVLRGQPDWSLLPAQTPANVRRLLRRCIEKDPSLRLRDAGDAVLELEGVGEVSRAPERARSSRLAWSILCGAVMLGLGLFAGSRLWNRELGREGDRRVCTSVEAPGPLFTAWIGGCIALTGDGQTLVSAAVGPDGRVRLHTRRLDGFESITLEGTEDCRAPFISPDGQWIGFFCGDFGPEMTIKRIRIEGGPTQHIANVSGIGGCWSDDGTLIVSAFPGVLQAVPASGGEARTIFASQDTKAEVHSQPVSLPGSRSILFTCWLLEGAKWRSRIETADLVTGERRVLVADAVEPVYARGRQTLVFRQGQSLMAVPLSLDPPRIAGEPRAVVGSGLGDASPFLRTAIADDGTLAFVAGESPRAPTDLAWFYADGRLETVFRGESAIWTLRLSPDASRVAFTVQRPESGLWVVDLARGNAVKIFSEGTPEFPVWTPDGARIAFARVVNGLSTSVYWAAADGSDAAEVLFAQPDGAHVQPTGFSPDGKLLLVMVDTGVGDEAEIYVVSTGSDRTATRLLGQPADRAAARFSPDGSLVAYSSRETGRPEIYLHPYPAMDRKVRVSTDGGERPAFSADGKRIFWRWENRIYGAEISSTPALTVGLPRLLLKDLPGLRYDAAPDGERFIMARPRGSWAPQTRIDVVVGGLNELGGK